MKVAFVTAEYPPKNVGGAGISSELIVNELRNQGYNIDVYALNGEERQIKKVSPNHYELPNRDLYPVPSEIGENISVLHKLPDLRKYDLVHSYNTGHLPAVVARVDPPVLATINNHMWVCIDPVQFLKEACPPADLLQMYRYAGTAGYSGIRQLGRFSLEILGRSLTKQADAITVQNLGMKQVLNQCGYDSDMVSVVPNLVDSRFLISNEESEDDEKQTLIFLGRLVDTKGAYQAVEDFADLPRDIHKEWKFHIYGRGPQESKIQQFIKETSEEVEIALNYCPYTELPQVYRQADALIHASKYTEPFSRTWLEAMASETPIICSRNPSSETVLSDVAVLYDPFDEEEPRSTLEEVLTRDDLQSLAEKGKEHVENYQPNRVCSQYADLYEELV